jgi:hypothetical protein
MFRSVFETKVEYVGMRKHWLHYTGTFHSKNISLSSSLLQGKYLPFSPSPLRLNIFRLFVILSLTQLYRYTPEIFLFSTATFKYTYRARFNDWKVDEATFAKYSCPIRLRGPVGIFKCGSRKEKYLGSETI